MVRYKLKINTTRKKKKNSSRIPLNKSKKKNRSKSYQRSSLLPEITTWEQIQATIIDNYSPPNKFSINPTLKINSQIKKLIDNQIKDYHSVTKKELIETLKFLFKNYKCFLFFSIRNNQISGYYIYNVSYQNNWHHDLKTEEGSTFDQFFKKYNHMVGDKNPKKKIGISDRKTWYSNNCVLKTSDQWYFKYGTNKAYINGFLEMLEFTKHHYGVLPDCDFFINKMDFPFIRKDKTFSYQNLYSKPKEDNSQPDNPWFLCSQSKTKEHLDIVIPNSDEWEDLNKFQETGYNQNWKSKKNMAIFRGSSTGCETTVKDNPRLWYAYLSSEINKDISSTSKSIIDVKIVTPVKKLKVNRGVISYLDPRKLTFKIDHPRMDMNKQSNCKYIFNIEGNVSAYRYGNLFATKSLIINVKSDYYLWFEPLLTDEEIITFPKDISKGLLQKKIHQIIKEDSQSKEIAQNGYNFFKKYINKKKISQYWFYLLVNFNKKQKLNKSLS